MRRLHNFSLVIRDPIGTDGSGVESYPIDTRMTSMSASTRLPGGFDTLNVGLQPNGTVNARSVLTKPVNAKPFSDVEVWAGHRRVYHGRLARRVRIGGGGIVGLTAHGYGTWGLTDAFYANDSDVACLTGNVVRDAMQNLSLVTMALVDGPLVRRNYAEFGRMTIAQVLNKVIAEGSPNALFDFYVYEHRKGWFVERVPPAHPTYAISFDDSVTWEDDYSEYYSGAAITYLDEDGLERISPTVTRPLAETEIGIGRTAIINAPDGDTPTSAQRFRDAYLDEHANRFQSARIERRNHARVGVYGGGEIAGYLVRSGEWVQIGDESPQIVVRTSYDFKSGNGSFDVMSVPKADFRTTLNRVIASDGNTRRGIDPRTLARRRRNWSRLDRRDFNQSQRRALLRVWRWLNTHEPDGWIKE